MVQLVFFRFIGDPTVQERFPDTAIFTESPQITGGCEGDGLEDYIDGKIPGFLADHQVVDYDKWYEVWTTNR